MQMPKLGRAAFSCILHDEERWADLLGCRPATPTGDFGSRLVLERSYFGWRGVYGNR